MNVHREMTHVENSRSLDVRGQEFAVIREREEELFRIGRAPSFYFPTAP